MNRLLVAVSDDGVFQSLLARFDTMGQRSQELLGFAVVDRGPPWIARFQRLAFARPGRKHHHRLAETVSLDVDDDTARAWIAAGYDEIGWRVLIARHGEAALSELMTALPESFAGLDHVPALSHMRFLENAPAWLIDELWARIGSPMQPKTMQDVLNAVATCYPAGMASIVGFIARRPDALPAYHLGRVINQYNDWRKRFAIDLGIQVGDQRTVSFPRWIAAHSALQRWEDHFTPAMLASLPDLAVEFALAHLQQDDRKAMAVLRELRGLMTFNAALFDRMLAVPALAALVPDVFADCFDTFPTAALQRCISCPHIDQEMLLFRLSATNNPLHRPVHAELIQRALDRPVDLHQFRHIANMLRGYSHHDVVALLEAASLSDEDKWIWLGREVEVVRGQRLINEVGHLRH